MMPVKNKRFNKYKQSIEFIKESNWLVKGHTERYIDALIN
jgi:hypothetical protein